MTATTVPRTHWGVRVGTNLTGALLIVGTGLMLALSHWPGLIKLAGLVTVALAFVAREVWRRPQDTPAATAWVGFAALPATGLVALLWIGALPGERIATVAIVAVASVAYYAAVVLGRRHGADR